MAEGDSAKARAVYVPGPAAEAMLKASDRCWTSALLIRGRLHLYTPFGAYLMCPTPSYIASAAQKLAEAWNAPYLDVYKEVADAVCRALITARGLENGLYAEGRF